MNTELLLQKTRTSLPLFAADSLDEINIGGSDRKFYRVTSSEKKSAILVHYNNHREENKHYASHATFLKNHSLNVPTVIKHVPEESLLWLEDLGNSDLWSQRENPWHQRRPFYEATLIEVARLHRIPVEAPAKADIVLQKEFNEDLYRWEQDYFLEHALGNLFGINETTRKNLASSSALKHLADSLAALPRQLIHRDLQSQNVMLHDEKVWLIDFQGFRAGLAEYDLASLLYDPYVNISDEERDELLHFYEKEMQRHGVSLRSDFKKIFLQCAAQRLMQALGAYGFLSLQRGKTHYRAYVAPALTRLREVLAKLPNEDQLPELVEVLENMN